jgi:hypothetical protein
MYGSVNVHEKRVYDLDGNLIESRSYDTSGNLEHKCLYKYKRDSRGNWIEKNCSCTDGEKFITKREIEYY